MSQDGDSIRFFETPTPTQANGEGILGFVKDTNFSHDRGFYDRPFDLVIRTTTKDAEIYYTTDGSKPSSQNGTLYDGPITISTTTTLRAIAFKIGYIPTNVDTQTYLFPADVLRQSNSLLDFLPSGMGIPQTTKWIQKWSMIHVGVWIS